MIHNYAEMHKKQYAVRQTWAKRALKEIYDQSKENKEDKVFNWPVIYDDLADKYFLSTAYFEKQHNLMVERSKAVDLEK